MIVIMSKKKYYENLAAALRAGFKLGYQDGYGLASGHGVILAGVNFEKQPNVEREIDGILREKGF